MKTFIVFRNPLSGHLEAVKQGYSIPALLLNLICLGWVWAFARRAPDLAWRLLAVTVIGSILCNLIPFLSLFWIIFSICIGQIANQQIRKAFKKRGFSQIGEFEASDADEALRVAEPAITGAAASIA